MALVKITVNSNGGTIPEVHVTRDDVVQWCTDADKLKLDFPGFLGLGLWRHPFAADPPQLTRQPNQIGTICGSDSTVIVSPDKFFKKEYKYDVALIAHQGENPIAYDPKVIIDPGTHLVIPLLVAAFAALIGGGVAVWFAGRGIREKRERRNE